MNKKIISLFLAGVCAVSAMSIPVSTEEEQYKSSGTINASIPTSLTAFINPYRLSIDVSDVKDANLYDVKTFNSGVVSPTYYIENFSTSSELKVSVVTKLEEATAGLTFSEKPLSENEKEKKVFAYLNTTTLEADSEPLFYNTKYDADSPYQSVFTKNGTKCTDIMTIGKSENGISQKGYFRVEGESTAEPENMWKASDSFTLSLILDLAPYENKNVSLSSIKGIYSADPVNIDAMNPETASFTASAENSGSADIIFAAAKTDDPDMTICGYLNGMSIDEAYGSGKGIYANGVYTISKLADGTDYNAGDVITVVIKSGNASETYMLMFTS